VASHDVFPDGWEQQQIVPSDVMELRLRVGVMHSAGHYQVQMEALDPSSKILIAMESSPHISLERVEPVVAMYVAKLLRIGGCFMADVDPFPD